MRKENHSYEKDFYKWTQIQSSLLKHGEYDKIDIANLVEEIESLGKSDKRALYAYLVVLLNHLLKITFCAKQQGNSNSWKSSIMNSRRAINRLLTESPSLKNECEKVLNDAYEEGYEMAKLDTVVGNFPKECPWSLSEILNDE